MKKKNCRAFEIVAYVAAAIVAIVGVYMMWSNVTYISEYLAAYGMTFADMKGEILQTVLPVFAQYFTYAFVLFGMGRIYRQLTAPKCEACEAEAAEEVAEEAAVEEIVVAAPVAEAVEEPVIEAVEEPKED